MSSGTQATRYASGVYFLNETPFASIAGTSTFRVDGPIPKRDFNSDLETVAKSSAVELGVNERSSGRPKDQGRARLRPRVRIRMDQLHHWQPAVRP